jgi:hypothetical protein
LFQSGAHVSSTSIPSMSQSCTKSKSSQKGAQQCEVARKDEAEKTRRLEARRIPPVSQ